MNTVKNNFIKVLFSIFLITSMTSCDEGGDPTKEEIGMTTTGMYAGDWFVDITDSDGVLLAEHVVHNTYNTSANDNTMWMDDHGDGYQIKSKFAIDLNTGQFSATDAPNFLDVDADGNPLSTVTITEGRITKFGATSKGGHVVDKIEFRVHYSYDAPGYDIIYVGHKRTGFGEDEY